MSERTVTRSSFLLAATMAGLFAAVAVLLAIVAVRLDTQLDEARVGRADLASDRAEIRRTAGAFSEALLTYRHDDLDTARERVLALSTGRFRREYQDAFEGLAALVTATEASATATVKAVFVGEVDGDRAEAITVVDAIVEGTSGRRPLLDSYIRLDLVRVDGEWRIDFVTNLTFAEAAEAVPSLPEVDPQDAPDE